MEKARYSALLTVSHILNSRSDFIGASASSLCMIHCMITPFLFVVQATSLSCSEISPWWWKMVDYVFLVVTFFAIYFTNKNTSSKWMPIALYACWVTLALLIVNASLHFLSIPHVMIYFPALTLAFLHLYNRRYCRCQPDKCCVSYKLENIDQE